MRDNYSFTFSDACVIEDAMYVSANEWNALFKINLRTQELSFLSECNDRGFLRAKQHKKILHRGDELLLVPYMQDREAWEIDVYNLTSGAYKSYELPYLQRRNGRRAQLVEYALYGDRLGIFPREKELPAMIMDLSDKEVGYLREWPRAVGEVPSNYDSFFAKLASCQEEVVIPIYDQSGLILVNLETESCRWCECASLPPRQMVCRLGGDLCFSISGSPDLLRWNPKGGEAVRYGGSAAPVRIWGVNAAYSNLISAGDQVIAISMSDEGIYLLDESAGCTKKLHWSGNHERFSGLDFLDANSCAIGSAIHVIAPHEPYTLEIHLAEREVRVTEFQKKYLDRVEPGLLSAFWRENRGILFEEPGGGLSLENFLSMISRVETAEAPDGESQAGAYIHSRMVRELSGL